VLLSKFTRVLSNRLMPIGPTKIDRVPYTQALLQSPRHFRAQRKVVSRTRGGVDG